MISKKQELINYLIWTVLFNIGNVHFGKQLSSSENAPTSTVIIWFVCSALLFGAFIWWVKFFYEFLKNRATLGKIVSASLAFILTTFLSFLLNFLLGLVVP